MPTNKKKARGKKQKKQEAAADSAVASNGDDASRSPGQGAAAAGARGRSGVQNPFTATTQSELAAIVSPAVVSSAESDPVPAPDGATCWICLEGMDDDDDDAKDEPLRRNCACRGASSGYVHLTCLASYAASRSEEIWTGKKKAAENTNWLAFGRPWESCANCKQYYAGQLRIDLAYEYARSTEGMVSGPRAFRHVTARSWITKSLMGTTIGDWDFELCRAEFGKLIDLIQSVREAGVYEGLNPVMGYLRANLQQMEAEANTNFSTYLYRQLLVSKHHKGDMTRPAMKRSYHECCNASARSIEGFEALKSTILGQDPESAASIDRAIDHAKSHLAKTKHEFSHLEEGGDTEEREKEMLELSEKVAKTCIEERGEDSFDAINSAFNHGRSLMKAKYPRRPFEAADFLTDLLVKSRRALGPSHQLTKSIAAVLDASKKHHQKCAYYKDLDRVYYPVDRFEDGVDLYIMDIEHLKGGPECGWAPSDVILMPGALVTCVGLKGAKHLNGKKGWIVEYDDSKGRHMVEFEDTNIKPCLVKPVNLRLAFLDGASDQ